MTYAEREALRDRLSELSKVKLTEISKEELEDINKVEIDRTMKPEDRILSLLEQTRNPYIYRDGSIIVKISFANNGKTMQSCMEDYLESELSMRMQSSFI